MEIINTHEAKTHLSQLLARAARGEEFIIAKAGKPVARLIGFQDHPIRRTGHHWKGLVTMEKDFNDPLPEDLLKYFDQTSS